MIVQRKCQKKMVDTKFNLSGRRHIDSVLRLRESTLPYTIKQLLESIFFHTEDYQGKGDVWWKLIDLLESVIVVSKRSEARS